MPQNNIVSHTALRIRIKNPVDEITVSNACQSNHLKKKKKSKYFIENIHREQILDLNTGFHSSHMCSHCTLSKGAENPLYSVYEMEETQPKVQGVSWGPSCAFSEKSEELEKICSEMTFQVS